MLGYRVRYTTSAELLADLTKRLADQTLPKQLRYYARFDWLIIDEFAFDKIERSETPQAASLLFKIIDGRKRRSTTVVTNIDFDAWGPRRTDAQTSNTAPARPTASPVTRTGHHLRCRSCPPFPGGERRPWHWQPCLPASPSAQHVRTSLLAKPVHSRGLETLGAAVGCCEHPQTPPRKIHSGPITVHIAGTISR